MLSQGGEKVSVCFCSAFYFCFMFLFNEVTQFLCYSFLKGNPDADAEALQMLLADFDALATGLLHGTPIARDGRKTWKFVLLVAKADEEARCNVFGLPQWGTHEPCPECLCNRDMAGRPYIFVYVIF